MKEALAIVACVVALVLLIMGGLWLRNAMHAASTKTSDWTDSQSGQRYIIFTSPEGLFVIKAEAAKP